MNSNILYTTEICSKPKRKTSSHISSSWTDLYILAALGITYDFNERLQKGETSCRTKNRTTRVIS